MSSCINNTFFCFSRPHSSGEEDLSLERSILPNTLLKHSNILEAVLNIRNYTLREDILANEDLNIIHVDNAITTIENMTGTEFNEGDIVVLKVDLLMGIEREFEITEVKIHNVFKQSSAIFPQFLG